VATCVARLEAAIGADWAGLVADVANAANPNMTAKVNKRINRINENSL
jgi:hypothetical protein